MEPNLRYRYLILAAHLLFSSVACSSPSSSESEDGSGDVASTEVLSDEVSEQAREYLIPERQVPEGWVLLEQRPEGAMFTIPYRAKGQSSAFYGTILLHGQFEHKLDEYYFSYEAYRRDRARHYGYQEVGPEFEGFAKVIDSPPLGFDRERNQYRHGIRYFNRTLGIKCFGYNPGWVQCFWGAPEMRNLLRFHSDDTVIAFGYLAELLASAPSS